MNGQTTTIYSDGTVIIDRNMDEPNGGWTDDREYIIIWTYFEHRNQNKRILISKEWLSVRELVLQNQKNNSYLKNGPGRKRRARIDKATAFFWNIEKIFISS